MKKRNILHSLSDLLPEILIEAQGCDEITAKSALRRAVETLCQNHGFGAINLWYQVDEKDINDEGEVVLPLDEATVLFVNGVYHKGAHHTYHQIEAYWENGLLYIPSAGIPFGGSRNGHKIGIKVEAEVMPDVDADIENIERFTKWRNLIIDTTLEDLLSMEGKPWANASRYQVFARRAAISLEEFLIKERYSTGATAPRSAAPSITSIWH